MSRYLPNRSSDFNLREHIEGCGHNPISCRHVVLTDTCCRYKQSINFFPIYFSKLPSPGSGFIQGKKKTKKKIDTQVQKTQKSVKGELDRKQWHGKTLEVYYPSFCFSRNQDHQECLVQIESVLLK